MIDISRLDVRLLLTLDVLLREASVSRTARRLGQSQSNVSNALARLRDAAGDPLFVRVQRGLVPTPRAEALRQPLADALGALRRLGEAGDVDPSRAERVFSVHATDYAQATVLEPALAEIADAMPGLTLVVRTLGRAEIADPRAVRQADFVVGTPQLVPGELRSRAIGRDRLRLFCRRRHPLTQTRLDWAGVARHPHVLVTLAGANLRGRLDEQLARAGLARRVVVAVESFLFLPQLLSPKSGRGRGGRARPCDWVAVAPGRLAEVFAPELVALDLPGTLPPVSLHLAWGKQHDADPVHRVVRERIVAAARRALAGSRGRFDVTSSRLRTAPSP